MSSKRSRTMFALLGILGISLQLGTSAVSPTTSRPPITDSQLVQQFVYKVLRGQNVSMDTVRTTALQARPTPGTKYSLHELLNRRNQSTSANSTARQSDLLKQIKMQFLLDCALLDQKSAATTTPSPQPSQTTAWPTTLPYRPPSSTTQAPSAQTPRKPKVQYDNPMQDFFDNMYDFVQDSFTQRTDEEDDDADDDGDSSEESPAHPNPFPPTEPTYSATTRRIHQQQQFAALLQQPQGVFQPVAQPPTIVYTLPQSIPAGFFPQYAEPADAGHRDKRTTQLPYGYAGYQPSYVKGPHQFVTGNMADANDPYHKNSYLSTQIQVTSAYNPAPTSSAEAALALRRKKAGAESGSDEDEFGFYDAVDLDGLNVEADEGSDSRGDEDSGAEGGESEESESTSSAEDDFPARHNKKIRRKDVVKVTKKPVKYEDYSYEDDEPESGESLEKVNSPSSFFDSIFGNFFAPISWIWPSSSPTIGSWSPFRMFGGGAESRNVPQAENRIASSSKVVAHRRPKQPSFELDAAAEKIPTGNSIESGPEVSAWFDPFQASAEMSENWFTTSAPPTETLPNPTESTGFWSWFGGGGNAEAAQEVTTTMPPPTDAIEIETSDNNTSVWNFFGMFGGPSTTATTPTSTTTRRPFMSIANPLQNPSAWLGILAAHMASAKPPTVAPLGDEATPAKKRVSYVNYQLWRLRPATEDAVAFLQEFRRSEDGEKLQWWRGPSLRGSTEIVVPPSMQADLRDTLVDEDIAHDILMWDLSKAILYENPDESRVERTEHVRRNGHPLTWHRYHRYADIVRFMEHLQRNHSETVELLHIGRSFEGRPLTVVRISGEERVNPQWRGGKRRRSSTRPPAKRAVFIEAGAHGREWIGPATATWMVQRLVERIGGNDTLAETLRMVDWYVLPVLNPDGYEFSHKYDRFWRKTRSKHAPRDGGSLLEIAMNWVNRDRNAEQPAHCVGTDPNRNWDWQWNRAAPGEEDEDLSQAFKTDCSEFYAGPSAFSEPETKAVSTFLMENRKDIKIYISLHAYGQMISYPRKLSPNPTTSAQSSTIEAEDPLYDMAHVALESMRSAMHKPATTSEGPTSTDSKFFLNGVASALASQAANRYSIDRSGEMVADRGRSGRADAYAMLGGPHIKYAYTLDLRDAGTNGFLLPPSNIALAGREAFELVRGMVDYM